MNAAHGGIGQPFPRVPGLAGARKRIGVGARQGAGGEDRFAVTNVPSGIGIAEQLPVTLEEEQAIEQRDTGSGECQIRHTPPA